MDNKRKFAVLPDGTLGWNAPLPEEEILMNKFAPFQEVGTLAEMDGQAFTKFDWWQVSVDLSEVFHSFDPATGECFEPIDKFMEQVNRHYPSADWSKSGGKNGYAWQASLKIGERRIMGVSWGGSHDLANIVVSGSETNDVRSYLIGAGILPPSGVRVSRVDSAFDSRSGTAAFREIAAWAEFRAAEAGIKDVMWWKNMNPTKGDTLYIGSKSSRVQIRIYEKGKETGYLPDEWWRAEIQFRPRSTEKASTYAMSSGLIWGSSPFARELHAKLTGSYPACLDTGYVPKEKDLDHRLLQLSIQYGNLIAEALSIYGDAGAVVAACDDLLVQVGKPTITSRKTVVPQCQF